MTGPDPRRESGDAARPKAAPPDIPLRATPPPATRLRKSVVGVVAVAGVALISGSLAWAFVVQPELRQAARLRSAEAREEGRRGAVRPAEAVTEQPASYDRLPAPRGLGDPEVAGPIPREPHTPVSSSPYPSAMRQTTSREPGPRALAARSAIFFEVATPVPGRAAEGAQTNESRTVGPVYNSHGLTAPLSPYELKAGAVLPAALLTGVDTGRAGPVVAVVTQNVFDTVSGRHLVVPQGSRLIGRHEGDSAWGDRRAFLVWDRLILPNGKSLILDEEPGVDAQGVVGVRGQVDRRLLPLLTGTLFAGAITTLGQSARDRESDPGGWVANAGDAAAIEGAQVGGRLIDRELQVRPSIRLDPGAPVRVLITRDLVLEPYIR